MWAWTGVAKLIDGGVGAINWLTNPGICLEGLSEVLKIELTLCKPKVKNMTWAGFEPATFAFQLRHYARSAAFTTRLPSLCPMCGFFHPHTL